jgi:ATP-dependent Clp endopeptidase proteolytic subunit ClpP
MTDSSETIRESLSQKENAEARMADAQAEKFLQEARFHAANAEREELKLASEKRNEEKVIANDEHHFAYQFSGVVDTSSVKSCMTQLTHWVRNNAPNKVEVEIIFHSPGGNVIEGMALFDYISYLKSQGHVINTLALGMAASMAGILLQAGSTRRMGKEAWVLIHQGSFGAIGSVGQVEDTVEWVKRIQKRIVNIFAERSKLTPKQIERKWERKDWWLSSDECLKLGFIDEIRQ